jgi:ribosomal protein S18 acetylase RimI-like enzyme
MVVLTLRAAVPMDIETLTTFNQQLIVDEQSDSAAGPVQLRDRMVRWLGGAYSVTMFEEQDRPVAYCVWRDEAEDGVYVRQFFVARENRRNGVGRGAFALLLEQWSGRPIKLDVLLHNERAFSFYRSLGFRDYSLILHRRPDV